MRQIARMDHAKTPAQDHAKRYDWSAVEGYLRDDCTAALLDGERPGPTLVAGGLSAPGMLVHVRYGDDVTTALMAAAMAACAIEPRRVVVAVSTTLHALDDAPGPPGALLLVSACRRRAIAWRYRLLPWELKRGQVRWLTPWEPGQPDFDRKGLDRLASFALAPERWPQSEFERRLLLAVADEAGHLVAIRPETVERFQLADVAPIDPDPDPGPSVP